MANLASATRALLSDQAVEITDTSNIASPIALADPAGVEGRSGRRRVVGMATPAILSLAFRDEPAGGATVRSARSAPLTPADNYCPRGGFSDFPQFFPGFPDSRDLGPRGAAGFGNVGAEVGGGAGQGKGGIAVGRGSGGRNLSWAVNVRAAEG